MLGCWGVLSFHHIPAVAIVDVFHPARRCSYHPFGVFRSSPVGEGCLFDTMSSWLDWAPTREASHSWRMATACCGSTKTRRAGTDTPYHSVARPVHQLCIPLSFELLAWTRSQCSCCRCSRLRPSSRLLTIRSSCTGWHVHSSLLLITIPFIPTQSCCCCHTIHIAFSSGSRVDAFV